MVSARNADGVYFLCGDIEWDISMPVNDIHFLALNSECRIFTWLYHREDQMKLYGFYDERRRSTFLELLKVDGVGPKGALKIMSGISQDDLEKALENEDLSRLEAVPGLGKKTAQKMLLSLKGKLISSIKPGTGISGYSDLVESLANMGYERRAAAEALAKAEAVLDGSNLSSAEKEEIMFKEALLYLSGM